MEDLKEIIRTEILRVDTVELRHVQRAQKCIDVQGDHFQLIL